MRLINAQTYELEFFGSSHRTTASPFGKPQSHSFNVEYAILSHTWYPASEEVLYQDMEDIQRARMKVGWEKIELSCNQALRDKLNYVWVDTCCIDKSSSAELSEAINSMYQWYKNSKVCYAYLSDVSEPGELERSRWFTRGWTLQELLAPSHVRFYSNKWESLGMRYTLSRSISDVTGIDEVYLTQEREVSRASVAQRMSWAAKRQTTRVEDVAYSLLGIFNINMPLLYGEGENAFIRLQQEIIRVNEDQSIFAWDISTATEWHAPSANLTGALAASPDWFKYSADVVPCELGDTWDPPTVTSRGLHMQSQIICFGRKENGIYFILLKCRRRSDLFNIIAIPIDRADKSSQTTYTMHRNARRMFRSVPVEEWTELVRQPKPDKCYIVPRLEEVVSWSSFTTTPNSGIALRDLPLEFVVGEVYPRQCWMKEEGFFNTREPYRGKSDIFVRLDSPRLPSLSLALKFVMAQWDENPSCGKLDTVVMSPVSKYCTMAGIQSSHWQRSIQVYKQTVSAEYTWANVFGTRMYVVQIQYNKRSRG